MRHLIIYMLLMLVALPLRAEDAYDPTLPPDPAAAYTLTLTSEPDGHATLIGAGAYANNTSVTVNCLPDSGYAFSQWTLDGECVATSATYSFTMPTEDIQLVAQLTKLDIHSLVLTSNLSEAAILSGQGNYYLGDEMTISCTPNEDYNFQHWLCNDVVYSYAQSFTFTMPDEDVAFEAVFTHTPHSTITIQADDEQAGFVSSAGGSYLVGTTIEFSATARANYEFSHWTLNDTYFSDLTYLSYTVREEDDHFVAVFNYDPLSPDDPITDLTTTVNLESSPAGAATFNIASGTKHHEGDTLLIRATVHPNYTFVGWYRGETLIATSPEFIYIVGAKSETLTLRATPILYSQLTLQSQPAGAVTFNVSSSAVYEVGTTLALRAAVRPNYLFEGWYIGDSLITRTMDLVFTVPESATILTAMASIINAEEEEEEWEPAPPVDPGETPQAYITVLSNNTVMGRTKGTASYFVGDTITIQAIPNSGYLFTGWEDGSVDPLRSVVVTENATYTAYFSPQSFTVTVLSDNSEMGTVSGGGTYLYQSSATLVAQPAEGYQFVRWSDDNTEWMHNIYVTSDTTLIAYFSIITYHIAAQASNTKYGTVTGGGDYYQGDVIKLEAIPNEDCEFIQWSDGVKDNPRYVTVTQDQSFTAMFISHKAVVEVLSNNIEWGTTSGSGSYQIGDTITISASPNEGCQFTRWSDGSAEPTRTIVVTGDMTFTAYFESQMFTITALTENPDLGQVVGGGLYNMGDTAELIATPNSGCQFMQWSDGVTDNPRYVIVTQDESFTAIFIKRVNIDVLSDDETMGTTSGSGSYVVGETITISANPNEGYEFVRWSDGSTESTRTITVAEDITYVAYFQPSAILVTVISDNQDMGTVTGGGSYVKGDIAVLTAVANEGYEFVRWSDGSTESTRTIIVAEEMTYVAYFQPSSFLVTVVSDNPDMGTVTGGGMFTYQSSTTITAKPLNGYKFVGWSDGDKQKSREITVTSDTTFVAYFAAISYLITAESENSQLGNVIGGGEYKWGDEVTLTAVPNEGCEFIRWSDGSTEQTLTITVTESATYTASFRYKSYVVNALTNDERMGTVVGGGVYTYKTKVTLTAQPCEGYKFVHWSDGNTEPIRDIIVMANTTITAYFEHIIYHIIANAEQPDFGIVTGEGEYHFGDKAQLTAIPNEGYQFEQWSDGVTDNPRYVIVTQDETFTAIFTFLLSVENTAARHVIRVTDILGHSYADWKHLSAGAYILQYSDGTTQKIVVPN